MTTGIVPPNTPLVDGRGMISPAWYRYLVQNRNAVDSASNEVGIEVSNSASLQMDVDHLAYQVGGPAVVQIPTLNELADVSTFGAGAFYAIRFNATTGQWEAVNDHSVATVTTSSALTTAAYTAWVTVSGLTVTLPASASTVIGVEWTVILGVAGNVTIAPNGSDVITLPTTDTTVTLYNKGDSLTFRYLGSATWGMV